MYIFTLGLLTMIIPNKSLNLLFSIIYSIFTFLYCLIINFTFQRAILIEFFQSYIMFFLFLFKIETLKLSQILYLIFYILPILFLISLIIGFIYVFITQISLNLFHNL